MKKEGEKTGGEKKKEYVFTLRINEQQHERIKALAKERNCTVSAYLRGAMEPKNAPVSMDNFEKDMTVFSRKVRDDFKSLVPEYNTLVDTVCAASKSLKAGGEGNALAAAKILNLLQGLVDITVQMQGEISEVLRLFDEREVHFIARKQVVSKDELALTRTLKKEEFLNKYTYMQRISIIGSLKEQPTVYKNQNGEERMAFVVSCGKGADYNVYYENDDAVMEKLKSGSVVFVEGDVKFTGQKVMVFANVLKLMPEN